MHKPEPETAILDETAARTLSNNKTYPPGCTLDPDLFIYGQRLRKVFPRGQESIEYQN
jgi:hypothetical protein